MAQDETLNRRIREILQEENAIEERNIFGGRCFLHHGNMICDADAKNVVKAMNRMQKETLAAALKLQLHGKGQPGFEAMLECLRPYKLAKWPLLTLLANYCRPDDEVFVKPPTAKGVIEYFELEGIEYKPQPSWAFYHAYRDAILKMRSLVDPCIAPNNAAFGGYPPGQVRRNPGRVYLITRNASP